MYEICPLTSENAADCLKQLFENFEYIKNKGELLSGKHVDELLDQRRVYFLFARKKSTVIGYCLTYIFPSHYSNDYRAYLYDVEILPQFRKRGIGKALMNETVRYLKSINVEEMWLGVSIDNMPANALYKSTGGNQSEDIFYDFTFKLNP